MRQSPFKAWSPIRQVLRANTHVRQAAGLPCLQPNIASLSIIAKHLLGLSYSIIPLTKPYFNINVELAESFLTIVKIRLDRVFREELRPFRQLLQKICSTIWHSVSCLPAVHEALILLPSVSGLRRWTPVRRPERGRREWSGPPRRFSDSWLRIRPAQRRDGRT